MNSLKCLGISGSRCRQSTNGGLLRAAQAELPGGVEMAVADLSDVPSHNADLTARPAAVQRALATRARRRRG